MTPGVLEACNRLAACQGRDICTDTAQFAVHYTVRIPVIITSRLALWLLLAEGSDVSLAQRYVVHTSLSNIL